MQELMKSSQQLIKESNRKLVFSLINRHGAISRADIKKITRLSATTVSSLAEELIVDGLVAEGGVKDSSTSGRKAVLLHVCPEGGAFIGLDIQKNRIIADAYGLDFSPTFHTAIPFADSEEWTAPLLQALSAAAQGRRVLGVTIGFPGVIDAAENTLVSSTVLDTEHAANIYQLVKELLPEVIVRLRNNSGLIAYAEKEFGAHGAVNNLVYIDIDDGVGAGIILGGAIYDGSNGMAGEFGHISVDYHGKRCKCGSYGCLEQTASVPAILEKTQCATLEQLRKKLDSGDAETLSLVDDTAKALAFGINNIINIIDPELIVIGGLIRELGTYLLTPLRQYISRISLLKNKPVEYSVLEGNLVTLGGARFSFDEMFGA